MGSTFKRKRKRSDGSAYEVWVCEDEWEGKRKTITGKSEKEVKAKMKSWIKEMAEYGDKLSKTKESFGTYFSKYLFDVVLNEVASSTFTRYAGINDKYIRNSSIAQMKPDKITYEDMQLYFNNLRELSQASLNKTKSLLNGCFTYAKVNKVIRENPLDNFKMPKSKKSKKEIRIMTLEEQSRYIKALSESRLKTALLLTMFTGLRCGELIALTWGDVDFESGMLRINKSLKRTKEYKKDGEYTKKDIIKSTKTDRVRSVPIPSFILNDLKLMDHDTDFMFVTKNGTHYSADNMRREHIRVCSKAKIGKPTYITYKQHGKDKVVEEYLDVNFHALRHTYATRLYSYGEDAKIIQALLGHSKLSTTMDIYTHVFDEDKKKVTSKLSKIYNDLS